ncbi:alpha/beta hydrolase [Amycolatopsis sp. NBC_01480]|uniref:alpha/beta hydrolase n=1 Tax=Amycolatopsis sp. NBC_01480 TaxID=2903562 RepID=UPI002E2DDB56|nr:hypothetical protein [Amycolatopsis sp. NBC_01480]
MASRASTGCRTSRPTAPATGRDLPVIVFSHGMTLSVDDYAPLAGFWAAHGFVVVQPTHLDSLGLAPTVRASGASAPTT